MNSIRLLLDRSFRKAKTNTGIMIPKQMPMYKTKKVRQSIQLSHLKHKSVSGFIAEWSLHFLHLPKKRS
jgi:hypothetical protein